MPTYEYECRKCGNTFEKFQSIKDEPLKRCPKCKGKVRKIIGSGAGIIFKGSGFYQTDYRSENYKKGQKAEPTSSTASSSSTDSSGSGSKSGSGSGDKKDTSKSAGSPAKASPSASKD